MKSLNRIFLSLAIIILVNISVFATKITVQQIDISNSRKSIAKLRIFCSEPFVTFSGIAGDNNKIIQSGSPSNGNFYLEVGVTYPTATTARIAQFDIDSTTDGQDNKSARYSAYFVDANGRTVAPYQPFNDFAIPPTFDTGVVATWSQIAVYNNGLAPIPPATSTYSTEVIDRKIAAVNGLTNPMNTQGDLIVGGPGGMPMRFGASSDGVQRFASETGPNSLPTWVQLNNGIITSALGYTPVNKAGDTMVGFLVLNADPATALQAATKQYVDSKAAGLTTLNGLSGGVNPVQNFAVGGNFPNLTITSTASGGVGTHTYNWTGSLSPIRGGTGITGYSSGDIIYANGATTLTTLPATATGNVMLSGTAPSWGKVGLTTHISGLLPPANGGSGADLSSGTGYFKIASSGSPAILQSTVPATDGGTGIASYTIGDIVYANTTTTFAKLAIGASTTVLHGGATPAYSQVNLTADVTGTLPFNKGGTGGTSFAAGYIKSNGSVFSSQATPIPIADHIASPNTNGVVYSGASALLNTAAPGANTVLFSTGGAPIFSATPTLSTLTLGLSLNSVVFAGAAGLLSEDATKFTFEPSSSRLTVQNTIRLKHASGGLISFTAAATGTPSFTLPAADGTNGQVIATNGSGVLSFVDQTGGGGGAGVSSLNGLTGILSVTVNTSGTDIAVTPSSPNVIISIPEAGSSITRGLINNTTQTLSGMKTLVNGLTSQAKLILAGQTTTVYPIQFGTYTALLTIPIARALEYDDTRLYFTNSVPTRKSIAFLDDTITGNAAGFTGNLAGAISGPQGTTVYNGIVPQAKGGAGNALNSPTNGYVLRYDSGSGNVLFSNDASLLTGYDGINLVGGPIPLAVISNLGNSQIDAAAAIAWSKLNKAGSSLADLTTRSASDLSTGTLADARHSSNIQQIDPDGDSNPATGTGGRNQQNGYVGLSNVASPKISQAYGQEVWDVTDLTNYASTSGTGTVALLTTISSVAVGQFPTWNGTNWINTPGVNTSRSLTDGDLLKWVAASSRWENVAPSAGSATAFLDSSAHSDTVTAAPLQGALIVGNGTPKWARVTLDASNRALINDGTDTKWGKIDLTSANYISGALTPVNGGTGLASGTSGGVLTFTGSTTIASSAMLPLNGVVIGGGTGAVPSGTAAGTANQVFRVPGAGGAPAFGTIDLTSASAVTGILDVVNGGIGTSNSGGAYKLLPLPFFDTGGLTTGASTNNQVRVFRFRLDDRLVVTSITVWVANAGTGGTQFIGFGIYNAAGTLVADSGPVAAVVNAVTANVVGGAKTLAPGYYYLAWTATAVTTVPTFDFILPGAIGGGVINASVTQLGTAANGSGVASSLSPGQLPTTLGAISAVNTQGVIIAKLQN